MYLYNIQGVLKVPEPLNSLKNKHFRKRLYKSCNFK